MPLQFRADQNDMSEIGQTERDYSIPGMQISFTDGDGEWPLVIRTAQPQAEWQAHAVDPLLAIQPVATTILYRGRAWRIHESESKDGEWFYRLQPWPAEERWMQVVELDRHKLATTAREHRETETIKRRAHNSVHYELLLGWLPSPVQVSLSRRLHFSPCEASKKNGLVCFFVGTIATYSMWIVMPDLALLTFLLTLEGPFRWACALTSRRGCGLLIFEIPIGVYRFTRGLSRSPESE